MLKAELGAINEYMLHAEMCENWGYERLSKQTRMKSMAEMKHAEKLIERILFLEGTPQMDQLGKITIGSNVGQQMGNDLKLEKSAVADYNKAIEVCRKAGDNATADFLKNILTEEEGHVDSLETELGLIEQVGLQNYLAQQM
jgi:bacterioferritin